MSDLNIGVVVEGKTDTIVLEAALKSILDKPFILNQLQPEESDAFAHGGHGITGGGWGGVYKWCRQIATTGYTSFIANPLFNKFDALIIHLDADVTESNYSDYGITDPPTHNLPTNDNSVKQRAYSLHMILLSWLEHAKKDKKAIFCIASWCTETWVAVAIYGRVDSTLLNNVEENKNIYQYMYQKPASQRLLRIKNGKEKKLSSKYTEISSDITNNWAFVKQYCSSAAVFSLETEDIVCLHEREGDHP